MTASEHDRDGYTLGAHDLGETAVLVSCTCGEVFGADTHGAAMALWEQHADESDAWDPHGEDADPLVNAPDWPNQ